MRTVTRALPLLLGLLSACAIGGDSDDPTYQSALSGTASISLTGSSVKVTQTSDSTWSLTKTGSLSGSTVTWNINATKTSTTSGQLLIQGQMTVTNTGSGPATIGNIVVNLQSKSGNTWVTRSSDVANATDGDDAVTAKIHKAASSEGKAQFTENSASGELHFMDATNNTIFSLVPQVQIPSGGTRTLLFQAAFDNTVLNLSTGTTIRAEVIVSFGNATANGNSTANVDINGNGSIDADEARIRSVPARLTTTVPAQIPGNATVTLTDAVSDITKNGTVSFNPANVVINLGATSGTVTVTGVSGGASGGTITNCAHLTGASSTVNSGGFTFSLIDGVDLEACSTISVGASTCTPGVGTCGWKANDITTYDEIAWSSGGAATLLSNTFGMVYPGGLTVGGTHTITFMMVSQLISFIGSQTGAPGSLTEDLLNPDTTSAGTFASEVLALQLNVDYAEANLVAGVADFGDLYICKTTTAALNGLTVAQFLDEANLILGGGTSSLFTLGLANAITAVLNTSFAGGTPSTFAQQNLFSVPCN